MMLITSCIIIYFAAIILITQIQSILNNYQNNRQEVIHINPDQKAQYQNDTYGRFYLRYNKKRKFRLLNNLSTNSDQPKALDYPYDGVDQIKNQKVKCVNGLYNELNQRCICKEGYKSSGKIVDQVAQLCDQKMEKEDQPIDYGNEEQVRQLTEDYIDENTNKFLGLPVMYWILIGIGLLIIIIIITIVIIRRKLRQRRKQKKEMRKQNVNKKRKHYRSRSVQ